jgi:hypothetical protein
MNEKHPTRVTSTVKLKCSGNLMPTSQDIEVLPVFNCLSTVRDEVPGRNDAISYIVCKYSLQRRFVSFVWPTYDEDQEEDGLTNAPGTEVTIGPRAFGTENRLASVIGHEQIHVNQSPAVRNLPASIFWCTVEKPAYCWELSNMGVTGLQGGGYVQDVNNKISDNGCGSCN